MYWRSVLFVRKAHLRNLIYRPVLQSSMHFGQHEQVYLTATGIAKETIQTLFDLNEHTALIRTHPLFFHQLLLTAFGNLLLAVVNAASKVWDSVRNEFDMVLSLFKFLSSICMALRRPWQRLQGLRDLHAKLGASSRSVEKAGLNSNHRLADGNAAGSLSFDDIFPEFLVFSTPEDSAGAQRQSLADPKMAEQFSFMFDDALGSGNLFDFPFLDLESSLSV